MSIVREHVYNVVIIDDEPLVIEGLLTMIPWEHYGFKVIGSFLVPEEALTFMHTQPVHLIISDIRMPGCSGLELTEKIRASGIHVEVILMSGYQEFDYVKQAMQLKVHEYLVKPIFEEDVEKVLVKMYTQINGQEQWRKRYALSDEEQVKHYLTGEFTIHPEKHPKLSVLNRQLQQGFGIYVECIQTVENESNALVNVQTKLQEINPSGECLLLELGVGRNGLLIVGTSLFVSWQEAEQYLHEMLLSNPSDARYYCSNPIQSLEQLKSDWKWISTHEKHMTHLNNVKWIVVNHAQNYQTGSYSIDVSYQTFVKVVEKSLNEQVSTVIERLFEDFECQQIALSVAQKALMALDLRIYEYITSQQIEGLCKTYPLANPTYTELQTMEACLGVFEKQMVVYTALASQLQRQKRQSMVHQIECFIELHLYEPLTIKQLAETFHMHPNYLGQKLSETWGESFTSYHNRKRIEKSLVLMKTTSKQIEEIAEMVGYTNYHQFLKWFKRVTNTVPTQIKKTK